MHSSGLARIFCNGLSGTLNHKVGVNIGLQKGFFLIFVTMKVFEPIFFYFLSSFLGPVF